MVSGLTEQRNRRRRLDEFWGVCDFSKISYEEKQAIAKRTEDYAEEIVLPKLGFEYILRLNDTIAIWHAGAKTKYRRMMPLDFYCERGTEKWFIEVTAYIKKDMPKSALWHRLGVHLGVLFIKRDLSMYCLKEGNDTTQVYLTLKDIGLEHLSYSERVVKAWKRRHEKQAFARECLALINS